MFDDPDTRLQHFGPGALTDSELLSFLLTRGGAPGPQALLTARRLLERAGDLPHLARMLEGELCEVPGIGPVRARRVVALMTLAGRVSERPWPRGGLFDGPRKVFESLRGELERSPQEHFVVLLLDARLRKLRHLEVCRGGRNAVSVLPRDILEPAIREGASAIVLVHNHPSGDPAPSAEDIALTERVAAAADLLGISVRDHVVIGDGRFASLAELGHLDTVPTGLGAVPAADAGGRRG